MSVFLSRRNLGGGDAQNYSPVFRENTWAQIIEACQNDEVPDTWEIGDQKTMTIGGVEYRIAILGKHHDDYYDGSGKAPATFIFSQAYNTECVMKSTASNSGGYPSSTVRSSTFSIIRNGMPAEVKAALRQVKKATTTGNKSTTITYVSDDLFLLSEAEIRKPSSSSWIFSGREGTQYELFNYVNNPFIAKQDGGQMSLWTRTCPENYNDSYVIISSPGGNLGRNPANSTRHVVAPAFCF